MSIFVYLTPMLHRHCFDNVEKYQGLIIPSKVISKRLNVIIIEFFIRKKRLKPFGFRHFEATLVMTLY